MSEAAELQKVASELKVRGPIEVLAIGSSSTEGVGATSRIAAYPSQLEQDLERHWKGADVLVENAGVGGETADQTVRRLEARLQTKTPDLVIWQVGTNDAVQGGSEESFRMLVRRGIAAVRAHGADLILLDQQYYPTIKDQAQYERFVGVVRDTGHEYQVPVFSRYRLMRHWASGSAETMRIMLAADGFHMSDRGYDCLAAELSASVASLAAHSEHTRSTTVRAFP